MRRPARPLALSTGRPQEPASLAVRVTRPGETEARQRPAEPDAKATLVARLPRLVEPCANQPPIAPANCPAATLKEGPSDPQYFAPEAAGRDGHSAPPTAFLERWRGSGCGLETRTATGQSGPPVGLSRAREARQGGRNGYRQRLANPYNHVRGLGVCVL
jgi:hypothetical protein